MLTTGGMALAAQVPQPFPRPQTPARPAPAAPETAKSAPVVELPAEAPPTELDLGFPVYPSAQFVGSYDAGRGQRYYLYGSEAGFAALVKYYQGVLKTRGTLVFDAPATHVFEIGRFREETMAFPPGVTIKDYTWNGSAGYMNPKRDGKPARFSTIIQFVPEPKAPPVATAPTPAR